MAGLETANYVGDLDPTKPTGNDNPKSILDDSDRLIKTCLVNSFGGVTGAVTASHTELNYVDGVTSAIQTQLDSKGAIAGQTWTGTHAFPATTTGVTAAIGSNNTKFATTAYVDNTAMSAVLPTQTGYDGNIMSTEGGIASWSSLVDLPLFWMGIS